MVLLTTDKAQRISEIQQVKPKVVTQSIPTTATETVTTTQTVSGYDYEYERLRDKYNRLQDKIDKYKKKLSSGKSSEQDRIQYQRYVQGREDVQRDLDKLQRQKQNALSNTGYGVEKTQEPTSTVVVGDTTIKNMQTENLQSGGTYSYYNIDDVQVVGKNDYGRTTQTVSIKEQERQSQQQSVEAFNPKTFTVKRTVSPQESMTPTQYNIKVKTELEETKEAKAEKQEVLQNKIENLRTKGQEDYRNTLKGAGYLTIYAGAKVVEGGVNAIQVISPVDFQGNAQIPIVTSTYQFGKYLVTGEYIKDVISNPLGFTANFLGATAVLSGTPIKDVASKEVQVITYPIRNTPKFTSAEVKGGTEQYIKYGDNRINKQFEPNSRGEDFNLNIGEQNFRVKETQANLYGENFLTLRGRTQAIKTSAEVTIRKDSVKITQKTLDNKNAFDVLRDDGQYIVRDVIKSTQQQIKVVNVINVDEAGKITTGTDIKLKPVENSEITESTSKLSTQVDKKQSTKELDTLSEGVGKNQEAFRYKTFKQQMQEVSAYNQELVLVEERQGKVVNFKEENPSDITQLKVDVKQPIETKQVLPITMSMYDTQTQPVVEQPLKLGTTTSTIQRQDTQVKVGQGTFAPQDNQLKKVQITEQVQEQQLKVRQRTDITQRQEQVQQQAQVQIQQQQVQLRTIGFTATKIKPPIIITPTPKPPQKQDNFSNQLFTTQIKSKGQFKSIGTFGTIGEAFNRGKQYVESTASATFKVVSGGEQVKPSGFLPRGFYKSKFGITQERSQRIKSQGEKIEISAKGRQVQQARGLFKKRKGAFL